MPETSLLTAIFQQFQKDKLVLEFLMFARSYKENAERRPLLLLIQVIYSIDGIHQKFGCKFPFFLVFKYLMTKKDVHSTSESKSITQSIRCPQAPCAETDIFLLLFSFFWQAQQRCNAVYFAVARANDYLRHE